MTEHESVREMLALAAAGVLDAGEVRRIEQHARMCEACRAELEAWAAYTQGLRRLPQPPAPEGLLERTSARILQERTAAADHRHQALLLGALAIFGWMSSLAFWVLVRETTGGVLNGWAWWSASTALSWATAGTAALVLGRREMRRFL